MGQFCQWWYWSAGVELTDSQQFIPLVHRNDTKEDVFVHQVRKVTVPPIVCTVVLYTYAISSLCPPSDFYQEEQPSEVPPQCRRR